MSPEHKLVEDRAPAWLLFQLSLWCLERSWARAESQRVLVNRGGAGIRRQRRTGLRGHGQEAAHPTRHTRCTRSWRRGRAPPDGGLRAHRAARTPARVPSSPALPQASTKASRSVVRASAHTRRSGTRNAPFLLFLTVKTTCTAPREHTWQQVRAYHTATSPWTSAHVTVRALKPAHTRGTCETYLKPPRFRLSFRWASYLVTALSESRRCGGPKPWTQP